MAEEEQLLSISAVAEVRAAASEPFVDEECCLVPEEGEADEVQPGLRTAVQAEANRCPCQPANQRDLQALGSGTFCCRPWRPVGGLFGVGLLLCVAVYLDSVALGPPSAFAPSRPRSSFSGGQLLLRAVLDEEDEAADSGCEQGRHCCKIEEGVDLPGNDLLRIPYVQSPEKCCQRCRRHDLCLAWTWGEKGTGPDAGVCKLKGATPRPLTKVLSPHSVSGFTMQKYKEGGPLTAKFAKPGQSLYCYSLLQPDSYELGLIRMQFHERSGIFLCDEYALYSNRRLELVPGVVTGIVNSTLKCAMGGEFGTALNTGIFLAVWAKVIQDGRFLLHDWTVKADPDSVFFASRLRAHVLEHEEVPEGVYFNNCEFGLHGPLEVFSRNAVRSWALGAGDCVQYFTNLCSGPCGWGEDMFIDQCLLRKLKVKRVNDFTLLQEAHCAPPRGWQSCRNTSVVAFHPFKNEEDYRACVVNAKGSGRPP